MLETFISKVYAFDPDFLIGHNLTGGLLETLLNRIQYFKLAHWSRIGRFKVQ